ncbi:MAG: aminoacyl-tRNA hydrolase [bacterium]|nr:aminoacyl-tRNA hydrolase [Candidatus Sumerlaeota bacterium]
MKLIVGLGNPGRQYARTPHNAGFDVVNILAARHGRAWVFERRYEAAMTEIALGGGSVMLMKPLTYMNLSGRPVGECARRTGLEPDEILVISDDVHLPLGRLRLRPEGSHGGHKGLLSIINALGSLSFPRLRVGVKPENGEIGSRVEYVLGSLRHEERKTLDLAEQRAADAVEMTADKGLEAAMNHYNKKCLE